MWMLAVLQEQALWAQLLGAKAAAVGLGGEGEAVALRSPDRRGLRMLFHVRLVRR